MEDDRQLLNTAVLPQVTLAVEHRDTVTQVLWSVLGCLQNLQLFLGRKCGVK
jgi:hypothetical protein